VSALSAGFLPSGARGGGILSDSLPAGVYKLTAALRMCAIVTYSLGVILYELLNSTTPIERGESAAAQMSSRLTVGSSCMVVRNFRGATAPLPSATRRRAERSVS
jgi:hypothetical protein